MVGAVAGFCGAETSAPYFGRPVVWMYLAVEKRDRWE